jgi:hypothetical protein
VATISKNEALITGRAVAGNFVDTGVLTAIVHTLTLINICEADLVM